MPKIDLNAAPTSNGTTYPDAFADECRPRRRFKLGDAAGLTQFGVNLLHLPAGAWSSQRHWHETEDEMFFVVSGVMRMGFRDRDVDVHPGEFVIVPHGVEHRPEALGGECSVMLIEPATTLNTGNVITEKTRTELQDLAV